MSRITFNPYDFPNFTDAVRNEINWQESFAKYGYKSYQYNLTERLTYKHSLSPEEYTWFLLRWG